MKHRRGCPLFIHPTQRPEGMDLTCRCPKLTPGTDTYRVVQWFREHPGTTRYEAQRALDGIHVTARMSDARAYGIEFTKVRDGKAWRFSVKDQPVQLELMAS